MSVSLKNVVYAYPEARDKVVLNIDSWSVASQEKVFIHGPSGGGKSTLLNVLSGIVQPKSGEISVLGNRLDKMNTTQRDTFRANYIGYIFQQFNLIPYLNAVDNIRLANHFCKQTSGAISQAEIIDLLESFRIDGDDCRKPTGKLSIGQQQRIAIARALINRPAVLIADEPTSSLDETNRNTFMLELLANVARYKTTLIFVSHDLSLATHFDRIDPLNAINGSEQPR